MNINGYNNQPYAQAMKKLMDMVMEEHGRAIIASCEVRHDDNCPALLSDGFCRCNPDIIVRNPLQASRKPLGSYVNGKFKVSKKASPWRNQ